VLRPYNPTFTRGMMVYCCGRLLQETLAQMEEMFGKGKTLVFSHERKVGARTHCNLCQGTCHSRLATKQAPPSVFAAVH
jgi:hypothetical protein